MAYWRDWGLESSLGRSILQKTGVIQPGASDGIITDDPAALIEYLVQTGRR